MTTTNLSHRLIVRRAGQRPAASQRSSLGLLGMTLLLLVLPACGLQAPDVVPRGAGTTELAGPGDFVSAPAPPAAPTDNADAAVRAIEEADILKFADGRAYALHQSKGMFIIDVSNPDAPGIMGHLEFSGTPVELYVVGARAYVITHGYVPYAFPGGEVDALSLPPPGDRQSFEGSKVSVIDVSNPLDPKSMGDIRLVGYANASRRVGDVLYVVGTDQPVYSPVSFRGDADEQPVEARQGGFVASINVADPNNVVPVERKTFAGYSLNLHVSETALLAASTDYGVVNDGTADPNEPGTRIQFVDISDPAGHIALRDTVTVPGYIRNRFYMDDFDGVLRIATESAGFGFQKVRVFTFSLANPDDITPLGTADVIRNETLQAVRFDGPRAYLVTFLRVDPLFVVDLTDATRPTVVGQLEIPGFSTHIEPRGDRLIAVGVDDQRSRRPAVVMYDVSDPKTPKQLSRIVLGPPNTFTESQAIYDEKAFKIVDEIGLIAIPFNYIKYEPGQFDNVFLPPVAIEPAPRNALSIAPEQPTCVSGVQLIDFSDDGLTQRGWFEHSGYVSRVGVIGSRAYAMSQVGFQTVNIDNRDEPKGVAFVPFLDAQEARYYGDCGYYGVPVPVDFVDGPVIPDLSFLDGILNNPAILQGLLALLNAASGNGTCGAIGVPAGSMMLAGMLFMQYRRRRR